MKRRNIVLICGSLFFIASYIITNVFLYANGSDFLKNIVDLPNIFVDQLPDGTNLTQEQSNAYVILGNELRAEARAQDYDRNDARQIMKSILFHEDFDITSQLQEFQELVKRYEHEIQSYVPMFSIYDLSSTKAAQDIHMQIALIQNRMNPIFYGLLFMIYVLSSWIAVCLSIVLFLFAGLLDRRSKEAASLRQECCFSFLFCGCIILIFDAIAYFTIDKIGYSIMRFMPMIRARNFLIGLFIGGLYLLIGLLLHMNTHKVMK